MPRNSSGVYQLPAGNPVVTGTLVESIWANSTMSDVAQALTDSLDRFGRSTMAAPLLINDGTVSAPGVAFGAESSTGLFRKSAKVLGISVGGIEVATFTQTGIGPLDLAPGAGIDGTGTTSGSWQIGPSNATSSLGLRASMATGIAGTMDFDVMEADAVSAAAIRFFRNTITTGTRQLQIMRGDGTNTADHILSGAASGLVAQIARNGGRSLVGTTTDNTIDTLQIALSARVRNGASGVGSNAAAIAGYDEFIIEGSAQTGMSFLTPNNVSAGIAWGDPQGLAQGFILYNHVTDQMQVGAAASANLILDAAYTRSTFPVYLADGTAAAPSLGFTAQPTWGLFRVPAVGIGLAVTGAEIARFAAAGLQFPASTVSVTHNDTASQLNICAAPTFADTTARIELFDSAHATNPRILALRGRGIIFTDATAATEKARFTAATDRNELLVGRLTALSGGAGIGLVQADGANGASFSLCQGGNLRGYLSADGAPRVFLNSNATVPLVFGYNGVEIARIDTDSTMHYTPPTTAAADPTEVGFRQMPVQSKSAAYTMRLLDRGCCIVQTTVANVITAAIFAAGDVVSVCNKSGSPIGLVATGITLNFGQGTPLVGNRTLANNGFASLFFTAANVATLTGSGLS